MKIPNFLGKNVMIDGVYVGQLTAMSINQQSDSPITMTLDIVMDDRAVDCTREWAIVSEEIGDRDNVIGF